MAKKELKVGQSVSWNSSGGKSVGKVVKKVTRPMHVKTHKVAASKENPEYLVRSDKSGKMAAHKPEELKSGGSAAGKKSSSKSAKKTAAKKPAAKSAKSVKAKRAAKSK